jgi:hypothetical protein
LGIYVEGMTPEIRSDYQLSYGMFSDEGNVAVHHLVTTLAKQLEQGAFEDEDSCASWFRSEMAQIEAAGHGEICDTDVRESLFEALGPALEEAAFDAEAVILSY